MLTSTELRKGTIFTHMGEPLLVTDYKHIKSARGGATIRVKVKNIKNGVVKEHTFGNGEKLAEADVENKTLSFLYRDGENVVLMDNTTYEQVEVTPDLFEGSDKFLKEGMEVRVKFFEDSPISCELPLKVSFNVTYTEPGFAGDTSTTAFKDAQIETGATIKVPLFIKIGETVVINTQSGEYVSRG